MDNHVHMLIEVEKIELYKIMQGIQQVYTQYYNKKYNRIGHVFSQRYKAILCNKDTYLLMLIRYIHQNPLRAGIEAGIEYEWSSHRMYCKDENNGIVDTEFPLKMFDEKSKSNAIQTYLKFVYEEDEVIQSIKVSEFSEGTAEPVVKPDKSRIDYSLKEIEEIVAKCCNVSVEELVSKRRYKENAFAKKVFIWLCSEYTDYKQVEVAAVLGLTQASVSKVLRNMDDQVMKIVEGIKMELL